MRLGVEVLGINDSTVRWGWPIGARAAHDLGDDAAVEELLAYLDDELPGRLARCSAPSATSPVPGWPPAGLHPTPPNGSAAAIESLRLRVRRTTWRRGCGPCGLPRGQRPGRPAAWRLAEARAIADRLGCRPVLARADALSTVEV